MFSRLNTNSFIIFCKSVYNLYAAVIRLCYTTLPPNVFSGVSCQVCNNLKFLKLCLKLVTNKTTLFDTRLFFTVLRVQHFRFQASVSKPRLTAFKCGRREFWLENRSISHLFSSTSCTFCYKYLKFIKFKCASIEGN